MNAIAQAKVEFENIKPLVGSIVRAKREDLFDPAVVAECRQRLNDRGVLVFPEVNFTDAEQLAFTDLFGGRVNLTSDATTEKGEDVYKVTLDKKINRSPEYVLGTFFWHMDGLSVDMPVPKATLLSARKTAAEGGQTEFSYTFAAYAALPDEEKKRLEGLKAVHNVAASLRPIADLIPEDEKHKLFIGVSKEHPLVWTREDGAKAMIIGTTADYVVGMEKAHGRALLTRLVEWAGQEQFVLRHQWKQGDFVIWDNRGAMHRVVPYDAESGRMMHRTSIAG